LEDDIEMDFKEMLGWGLVTAVLNTITNIRVPSKSVISWPARGTVNFARRTVLHGVSICILTPVYVFFNNPHNQTHTILISVICSKKGKVIPQQT